MLSLPRLSSTRNPFNSLNLCFHKLFSNSTLAFLFTLAKNIISSYSIRLFFICFPTMTCIVGSIIPQFSAHGNSQLATLSYYSVTLFNNIQTSKCQRAPSMQPTNIQTRIRHSLLNIHDGYT